MKIGDVLVLRQDSWCERLRSSTPPGLKVLQLYAQVCLLCCGLRMGQDSLVRKWPDMDQIIPIGGWQMQ
jgi:hypothetical protein